MSHVSTPNETTIIIQAVSVYGQPPGLSVQAPVKPLKPLSHEPGGPHTVSVRLVALRGGYDEHTVRRWAETGQCFVRLDWGFPNCNYPKFTTRHLLTSSGASSGDVSFSGGLDWAERMLNALKQLHATDYPDPPPPPPPPPPLPTPTPSSRGPLARLLRAKTEDGRLAYAARELDDDQISNSSVATCLTAASESSAAFSEPPEPTCPCPMRSSGAHPRRCQAENNNDENNNKNNGDGDDDDDHRHANEERTGDGDGDGDSDNVDSGGSSQVGEEGEEEEGEQRQSSRYWYPPGLPRF
ncbi:uncharacterized protein P884DRAFT_314454 [Thermothelomyces heterothallicus CBS 202.75]|uniref:uncharacterized protein n=1 Tax=Thermothelomyces heterothallicus CBS 202.75 TaxID=1149848 RepID=UPI003742029B